MTRLLLATLRGELVEPLALITLLLSALAAGPAEHTRAVESNEHALFHGAGHFPSPLQEVNPTARRPADAHRRVPRTPAACPEPAEATSRGPSRACRGACRGGPAPDLTARVVRVIDGDTVILEGGQHLRYLGIDTPEIGWRSECYGQKALAANAGLVENEILLLYFDRQKRDRYHRLLAYAFLEDGTFVNEWLVRQGYATTWILSPNIARGHAILDAENIARSAGRGLWKDCQ